MSGEPWRFIDSGAGPGDENMALDEALLEAHAHGDSPPVLRVYTWRPPAVSLGRFQSVESSVDLEACRRLGIDVVRRPTGGRAILHTEEELTFSIVVCREWLGTSGVMDSYRALAAGITSSLRMLGLDAQLVERSSPSSARGGGQDPACFAVKARCDLVVGSAKVVGSAQVQRDGFVLQQNSLPLRMGLEGWRDVFRRPSEAPAAAGLWELVEAKPAYAEIAAALRRGFQEHFHVELEESRVSSKESSRVNELAGRVAVLATGLSSTQRRGKGRSGRVAAA